MKRERVFLLVCFLSITLFTHAQKVGLKTNLIADVTTTINLGAEFGIKDKYTLDLYVNYNPWNLGDDKKFRQLLIQPEFRYWFCEKFNGHFIGVHAYAQIIVL